MTVRRALFAAFSTAVLLGLAWGCAAADNPGDPARSAGGNNGTVNEPGNDASITPDSGAQDSGKLRLNPLCLDPRVDSTCVPDSPMSCGVFTPPATPGEDASTNTDAAAGGQAGTNSEGGTGGDNAGLVAASGQSGAGGDSAVEAAGAGGASGAAGAAGASSVGPAPAPTYGCQVQRSASDPRVPFSRCAPAGSGGENAPCLTANDCQAGLGCVGDQNKGSCQKYCCQDADDCEPGTYCAPRPMRDAIINASGPSDKNTLMIPVCVHAENCDLSAPYPCPKGSECACQSGSACLVVRSDGTTTCAVPGPGKAGDSCPCAWGHVCSAATNKCLRLCYTRDANDCGDGKCQAASELPDGWGVCVGGTASGG